VTNLAGITSSGRPPRDVAVRSLRYNGRMTSDQQRTIEEKIIDGRLIEAIGLYRAATGCDLAEAERVVRERAAQLTGPPQPASHTPGPVRLDGAAAAGAAVRSVKSPIVPILVFVAVITLIPIVFTAIVLFGVFKSLGSAFGGTGSNTFGTITSALTAPGKLAGGMLVREPYYPTVVKDIEGDRGFQAALGTPIAIDESGITCITIKNGYTARTARCTLPVHGPAASGSVNIAVVDQPGSFGVAAQLSTGERTIVMGAR
jgi:hypothetical protein